MSSPPPEGRPPASSALPECAAPGHPGSIGVWAHDADVEEDDDGGGGDGDDGVPGVVSRTGFLRFPVISPVYSDLPVKPNKYSLK